MRLYEKMLSSVFPRKIKENKSNSDLFSFCEENTNSAVGVSGMGLWTYDVSMDQLNMNKPMLMMLGIKPRHNTSAMSLTPESLNVHQDDITAFRSSLACSIATRSAWETTFRVQHKDRTAHINICANVSTKDDGSVTMSGGAFDITRIIEAAEAAREMELRHEEDVLHQNDMNSMIRTIAHELRNPIQGVVSSAEMIEQLMDNATVSAQDTPHIIECARNILTCALYQSETLDDLLNFEAMNLKTYDVNDSLVDGASIDELISSAVAIFKESAAKKGVTLEYVHRADMCGTFHVKNVQTIIVNLLGNAVKFTTKGAIHVHCIYHSPFNEADGTATFKVCVIDSGRGVDMNIREKLFTTYGVKTSNMHTQGSGLGLRTCALIADAIGGTIGFDDRDDGEPGTTFYFTFNMTKMKKRHSGGNLRRTTSHISGLPLTDIRNRRILIADDNDIIRQSYSLLLKNDFDCTTAENGQEALNLYEESVRNQKPYDLLLLDLNMPLLTGIELALLMRKNACFTPIVFSTGEIGASVHRQVDSISNSHLLLKPTRKAVLMEIIYSALISEEEEDVKLEQHDLG